MKTIAGGLILALGLMAAGWVAWSQAQLTRRVADAHLQLATLNAIRTRLEHEELLPSERRHPALAAVWQRIRDWWERKKHAEERTAERIDYQVLVADWRASH